MSGRSHALDGWSDRPAVSWWLEWQVIGRRGFARFAPPPWEHDATRVGRDRVEQLDFHADDRPQPHLTGCAGKSDSAVEALVVGQGNR